MDLQLKGKHILVTGASKGIGLACVQAFLEEGARVSLVARTEATLHEAAASLDAADRVAVFPADLGDPDAAVAALDAAEAAHGPVDVLVNSAGAAKRAAPAELTPARWHAAMDAKYFTYIHMIDPVVKRMAARGTGAIVNVIGMGGKVGSPAHLAGGSANAALMLASAGLAAAYARQGVRVNALCPGPVNTPLLQELFAKDPERAQRRLVHVPMGRFAEPEELAAAVAFLASDDASFITASSFVVDGGITNAYVTPL